VRSMVQSSLQSGILNSNPHMKTIVGSADHTTGIWDLTEGVAVEMIGGHTDKVQSVSWHPVEPTVLLTGSFDHSVRLTDVAAPDSAQAWNLPGEIEKVAWNVHDPNYFLASTDSGHVFYMDVRGRVPVFDLPAHSSAVTGLALCPGVPGILITSSEDQSVRVWDIRDGYKGTPPMVAEKKCKIGSVFCAAACPDVPFVFAVGGTSEMKVLNVGNDPVVKDCFSIAVTVTSSTTVTAEEQPASNHIQFEDSDSDESDDKPELSTTQKAAAEKLKKKSKSFKNRPKKSKKH